MHCPICNTGGFYEGFTTRDCRNPECELFVSLDTKETPKKVTVMGEKRFKVMYNNLELTPEDLEKRIDFAFEAWADKVLGDKYVVPISKTKICLDIFL